MHSWNPKENNRCGLKSHFTYKAKCCDLVLCAYLPCQRRCQHRQSPPFTGLNPRLRVEGAYAQRRPEAHRSTAEISNCFLFIFSCQHFLNFRLPPDGCQTQSAAVVATYSYTHKRIGTVESWERTKDSLAVTGGIVHLQNFRHTAPPGWTFIVSF